MKKLLYIGNKLSEHGVNTTTIETLGPLLEQEGFDLVYASPKKNQLFRFFDMLLKIATNQNSDFVIIDTYSTRNFWYAFVTSQLCRALNIKYIPILHGGNLPNRLNQNPKVCQMIFGNSYINVAPSLYMFDEFKKNGFINCAYIPNAIELKKYPFKERKNGQPKLLWVRSFAQIYNPKMAIKVFCEIKEKYPAATLCMVGPEKDGSFAECQKLACDLNLEVVFTKKLSKLEWIHLSQNYDIFINTTHFDNMPVSVIEAMNLGLAVVSTSVGGIPFLLENNIDSILVSDNNVTEMVTGVEKIIQNSDFFQTLVTNAKTKATQFDWELVKIKWLEILH